MGGELTGQGLRELREAAGLGQKDIAGRILGWSVWKVSRIESGNQPVPAGLTAEYRRIIHDVARERLAFAQSVQEPVLR
jgi:transcriptional regulator with XRE-family HTH domain